MASEQRPPSLAAATAAALVCVGGIGFAITTCRRRKRAGCDESRNVTKTIEATNPDSELVQQGNVLLRWIRDYRVKCRDLPVISKVKPDYLRKVLPKDAPIDPEDWSDIVEDMNTKIVPGLTNWEAANKFFAYFKPHSSYPAVLGELVCAGINVMGFDWIASPAATELESIVLDWLARFLGLPSKFMMDAAGPGGGVIQGSAGESATVVFLASIARKRKEEKLKEPADRSKMVVYCSDQTHAIVQKATMILGVRAHKIETRDADNYTLRADALNRAIEDDKRRGLLPIAAVATTGTTNACSFDDLTEIGPVCRKHSIWLHVDAAYGGAYACLPELRSKFAGLDLCDSFGVNCHKKLLCPFDLAALYVADRGPILDALSLQPEYLRNKYSASGAIVDYEHWQMPLGRRFRALKLWFVFRRFGTSGLREHVRNGIRLAAHFRSLLSTDKDRIFELAVPVSLSLVCFRWAGHGEDDQRRLLEAIKETGDCFIIHTKLSGRIVLRFACGGIEQTKADVTRAYGVIRKCAMGLSRGGGRGG